MNKKHSIEEMKQIARNRNGKCLSGKYENAKTKLKWQCNECGYLWQSQPHSIISGSWCPRCANQKRGDQYRFSLKEPQKAAKEKGGQCLSKKYINIKSPLKWKCSSGHIWSTPFSIIRRGHWCPRCTKNTTEEKCRFIIENITEHKFDPSKIGTSTAFDGYCEDLKIAFEYQGEQHYYNVPYFHKLISLPERKKYDKKKASFCKQKGIHLIIVPYWESHKGDKHLIQYIKDQLPPYLITTHKPIDMSALYDYCSPLRELQKIAKNHGGECLSQEYINSKHLLKWKCKNDHTWQARPNHIKQGTWCKKCSNRKTIYDMQKLASLKGGKCLSEKYETAHIKLEWQCSEGHTWLAKPNNIQQGRWCRYCASPSRYPWGQ